MTALSAVRDMCVTTLEMLKSQGATSKKQRLVTLSVDFLNDRIVFVVDGTLTKTTAVSRAEIDFGYWEHVFAPRARLYLKGLR